MKHVILTLGIFSLGFLTSCDNATEAVAEPQETVDHHEHPEGENEHPAAESDAHSHDDGEAITLNDGEKWIVNEEMKPFVKKGESFVKAYADSGDEDYKSLAENLAGQNSQLISSCTMDGVSHDELHKWLHPHLELTKALKNADNVQEASHIVDELLASYEMYHAYFQ
ncbi:MAG TPA: hypothetical protein VFD77_08865 [Brumimicrobium sp.]|nr:hypothetical protein [Brumimicrobium sp.]